MTKTITFSGTVAGGSRKTLCSKRINSAYTVSRISAHFALNCQRKMRLYFFASEDDSEPTTGLPAGENILEELAPTPYLTGDDNTVIIHHDWHVTTRGSFLKVHAYNEDAFSHTIDCQVTIQEKGGQ